MKREQLIVISRAIAALSKEKVGVKFAYALKRNKTILAPEMEALADAEKIYQETRLAICRQFAEKDAGGKPIEKDGVFVGLAGNDLFKKAVDESPERQAFEKLLAEEVKLEFYTVDMKELPEKISAEELAALEPLLTGELK